MKLIVYFLGIQKSKLLTLKGINTRDAITDKNSSDLIYIEICLRVGTQ